MIEGFSESKIIADCLKKHYYINMRLNYDFDKEEKRKKRKKVLLRLLRWVIDFAIAIGIAYLLVVYTVEQCNMINNSMEPTIKEDETILISKIAFRKKPPQRYDLIVFKQTGGEHMYYDIKRVIGLPGETVLIKDGEIYINGEMLLEPVKVDPMQLAGFAEEGIVLDEDEYFVLGDNRNDSEDSRFASMGNVTRDSIVGMAWVRVKPFSFINKSNKNYVRPTPTPYGYVPPTPTQKPGTVTDSPSPTPSPNPTPSQGPTEGTGR